MGENLVLQVSGIPINLLYKMVRNKLLIHFLRRSNGGDGEVDVRYPTEEEGMAVLTFGHKEVANRVLSRRHHLKIEGTTYPLEVIRLQCWGTQVSKPLMALSLDGDEGSDSNGRPGYRSDGSSQPKNTSTEDSSSSPDKHHVSGEEAGKKSPIKSLPDKSSNKTSNRDPLPWRTKRTPEPLPTDHDGHSSTGDGSRTLYIKQYLGSDGSSQRRPNDTSSDDQTFNKKHPKSNMAANLHFHPGPTKEIPTDEDRRPGRNSSPASNGKPADSSGLARHTTFARTQFGEDFPESGQLKDTFAADSDSRQRKPKGNIADGLTSDPKHPIGDGSDFNPGQPKNTSTDELNPNLKYSKSTIDDGTKFNPGQPKNTSTDELNPNLKYSKSTIDDGTKFNPGQPKNTSTDELNPNSKHSKSTIEDSAKFNSGQPKNTSTDELNPNLKYSKSAIRDSTKFNSGQPKNTSTDELGLKPKHSRSAIGDSTKFNSGQPKQTFTDEFSLNPKHFKNTIGDSTKFSSGQPKNTSTDELNPKHSRSTFRDSTKFNPGQPKNTSTDELNLNPKLPKNHLGNLKPSNPQNSSPDEFLLNQRTREDLTASSPIRSSLMADGWSSSSSSTANSSTANHLDPSPLSTDFLVDPAAHTYVSVFMKDEINNILGQNSVEMKTETGDGFSRVILTTKSPHLSQNFYKAAHEISDIFMKCQSFLRVENIDLSNISSDVTKKLQLDLLHCGIWSSPNGERLQMIGPYEGIVGFMKKWTSAGGDFARFGQLLQEEASSASIRPPVVRRDNVHQSTAQDHNVTHDVHTQGARPRERGKEPEARGGRRGPNTTK